MEKKSPPRLESSSRLTRLIDNYYVRTRQEKEAGKPVVWANVGAPAELLWAAGCVVLFPESHSATCGGRKVATAHCQAAESRGFPTHLCSYAKNDIGSLTLGNKTQSPVGGLPKPDFLLVLNDTCLVVQKWWEYLSRHFKVPLFIIDTPNMHDEINREAIAYTRQQLLEFIAWLEGRLKRPFDYDRLTDVVRAAETTGRLWVQSCALSRHVPSPITMFDVWAHNFMVLNMRNRPEAIEHYSALIAEVEERMARGVSALPEEGYRLYWDNMVMWFAMGWLARKLSAASAAIVASTYVDIFNWEHLDSSRPLESLAENACLLSINRGLEHKLKRLTGMINDYSVDGMVMHFTKGCKALTLDELVVQDVVSQRTGIPAIRLDGDIVDSRYFSEEDANRRIDTLLEMIDARRAARPA